MDQVERLTGRQKALLGTTAALVLLVLVVNILLIGGVDFVQALDAFLPLPLALVISLLLFRLWRGSEKTEVGRGIWGSFFVGMALWFLAEGIWNVYSLLGLELPFPSLADIPWFIGYFFFFWALYLRFRSLKVSLRRREIILLVLLYTPLVILTLIYSIFPVFTDKGTGFLAAGLSIFYPLADLIIPFRSIIVMMAVRRGMLNRPWALISAGFLCLSISDLAFSFADSNNLYWPGGNPNFISISGDWLYIVAYTLMGLGVYLVPTILRPVIREQVEATGTVRPIPPTAPVEATLSTDASGKVCYVSSGVVELFGLKSSADCQNSNLSKLLLKSDDEIADMLRKIARAGSLERLESVAHSKDPAQRLAIKISALASRDDAGKFVGADFTFHPIKDSSLAIREDEGSLRRLLEQEKHPATPDDPKATMIWYFRAQVKVIYVLIARFAGIDIASRVASLFNETALKNEWPIKMDPVSLEITDWITGTLEERAHVYRVLLKQAADYAIAIASYSTTIREFQNLDRSVPVEMKGSLSRYGMHFPYAIPDPGKSAS